MSISEIRVWRVSCDGCDKSDTVFSHYTPSPPEGWEIIEKAGGGHYGLPIHQDLYCPKCLKDYNYE